jgi:hypothetical protein
VLVDKSAAQRSNETFVADFVDPADIAPRTSPGPLLPAQPLLGLAAAAGDSEGLGNGAIGVMGDTWRRRDLDAAFDGAIDVPTLLTYGDRALFYPGKINGIIGESESGKTWLALLAVAQEVNAGRNVVCCDFEDVDRTFVRRLVALGCDRGAIVKHVTYINPDEAFTAVAAANLDAEILAAQPTLVMLDGFNAAMARLELDSNSTTDATLFAQRLLNRLTATGAGVITIDHVSKNKETRGKGGVGSQAKRAMMSGAQIVAEVVTPFGRGKTGKIRLVLDKDRHGGVEAVGGQRYVGTARIQSTVNPDRVRITIEPPDDRPYEERIAEPSIELMLRISQRLARSVEGMSRAELYKEIKGNNERFDTAIRALVTTRCVEQRPKAGRGGGFVYVHLNHYHRPDVDDLHEDGDD